MRIVHEFEGSKKSAQGGGKGSFYGIKVTEAPPEKFPGFQADIMVAMTNKTGDEGDVLYLEGDGFAMRAALTSLLRTLDAVESSSRGAYAIHKASILHCERCEQWISKTHLCLKQQPTGAPYKGEKIVFTDRDGAEFQGTLEAKQHVPACGENCQHFDWYAHVCVDVARYDSKLITDWTKVRRLETWPL